MCEPEHMRLCGNFNDIAATGIGRWQVERTHTGRFMRYNTTLVEVSPGHNCRGQAVREIKIHVRLPGLEESEIFWNCCSTTLQHYPSGGKSYVSRY